jgi:death-on-curing family protein
MLGSQYVVYIHDELIAGVWADAGELTTKGCRDLNLLESAVSRPFQTAFGQDAYPTILDKSVALFHSLISNHPFHDGNKRTAVSTLYVFLLGNGHYFALTNTEAYQLAKDTASYKQRGLNQDQSLAEIRATLTDWILDFATLRSAAKDDPGLQQIYDFATKMRRMIRRNRMNRLIPSG